MCLLSISFEQYIKNSLKHFKYNKKMWFSCSKLCNASYVKLRNQFQNHEEPNFSRKYTKREIGMTKHITNYFLKKIGPGS